MNILPTFFPTNAYFKSIARFFILISDKYFLFEKIKDIYIDAELIFQTFVLSLYMNI